MLPDLRLEEEFFRRLVVWDAELARRVADARCPHCGGPLHRANYMRKPRGGQLAETGEALWLRHSLCCGREGCRRRSLPPSLRFLGRRVYLEAVVLLASVVVQLEATLRAAAARTGVPGRTLRRWGGWWRDTFPASRTWAEARSLFVPPAPEEVDLPRSLVTRSTTELTAGDTTAPALADVCAFVARLVAPVTTASVKDGARFVRDVAQRFAATAVTQKMAF
jgi:hypothetical protein